VSFADEPFSMPLFAQNVLDFMDKRDLRKVSIFGYSMGGYVAMYLAKNYPEKVNKVVTLATKYHWDETIAAREVQMLNPEKIEQKLPAFAATLKERHAPNDWKQVLQYTAEMMLSLGADNPLKLSDYEGLNTPALILLGDRDKMVSLDETMAVYKALPNAQMCLLPNTSHPIEQVDIDFLKFVIYQFIG
jgi:pimeloyl-ACP methyl ester carboxylesterase